MRGIGASAGRAPAAEARPRRLALLALALALASAPVGAAGGASGAAPGRAVLLRGADAVKGLPFFAPNAIPSLAGLYALDAAGSLADASGSGAAAARVTVWYSREGIVFASDWKRLDPRAGGYYAESAYSLERGEGTVLALKSEGYALFFELSGDPREAAFAKAFSSKFAVFFRNAASDAELSFPAYVDY
jgi:hypothetical protein